MEAIRELEQIFRQWLSAIRLFTALGSAEDHPQAGAAPSRASRPSLPAMSHWWLVEHAIASGKQRAEP